MIGILSTLLFFLIPTGLLVFFIVSLVLYCTARAANKRAPGTYTDSQMSTRKVLLLVSGAIAAVVVIAVLMLVALMFMAVAYM